MHTVEWTEFEWDDAKAVANNIKHRVRFEFAVRVFEDEQVVSIATIRPEDNEGRINAIGKIDCRVYTLVYTARGTSCRVIYDRRANRKEEEAYGNR